LPPIPKTARLKCSKHLQEFLLQKYFEILIAKFSLSWRVSLGRMFQRYSLAKIVPKSIQWKCQ